jgi:hypothetical protein
MLPAFQETHLLSSQAETGVWLNLIPTQLTEGDRSTHWSSLRSRGGSKFLRPRQEILL